jgi:hypothetical protein
MKWSQLKKRIEGTFADSVRGRVEVFETRYRESHDQEPEFWMALGGQRFISMGCLTYHVRLAAREYEMRSDPEHQAPLNSYDFSITWRRAAQEMEDNGVFRPADVNAALFAYLNLSIDEILHSSDPIIRAFGMLDRRFGKRRVRAFDPSGEHAFVRQLYEIRSRAEGLRPSAG